MRKRSNLKKLYTDIAVFVLIFALLGADILFSCSLWSFITVAAEICAVSISSDSTPRKSISTRFEGFASIALNRPGPLDSGMLDGYIEVATGKREPYYYVS